MKFLAILALVVSCSSSDARTCILVNGWEIKPSSKNVELALLLDGKPQANAHLTVVNLADGKAWRSLSTGPEGTAVLKDLPRGITCITATAHSLSAGLCLDVSPQSDDKVSLFRLTLAPTLPKSNSLDGRVRRIEESPPILKARSLKGTIMDPIGGVIPKAEIQVYKGGSYPRSPVTVLKTDGVGRFSGLLEPGIYTVIVQMSGFAAECLSVEIARDAEECELLQMLEVQAMEMESVN